MPRYCSLSASSWPAGEIISHWTSLNTLQTNSDIWKSAQLRERAFLVPNQARTPSNSETRAQTIMAAA